MLATTFICAAHISPITLAAIDSYSQNGPEVLICNAQHHAASLAAHPCSHIEFVLAKSIPFTCLEASSSEALGGLQIQAFKSRS